MYIDPDLNCVFYKHYGTFAFGEIAETAESRIDHPAFQVGMNILHDVRKLIFPPDHSYKHISEGARSMMATYDPKVGKCRSAMVVGDGRAYAKVHQFIVAGRFTDTPVERAVFREMGKAKEWLGIPEGYDINFPSPEAAK